MGCWFFFLFLFFSIILASDAVKKSTVQLQTEVHKLQEKKQAWANSSQLRHSFPFQQLH